MRRNVLENLRERSVVESLRTIGVKCETGLERLARFIKAISAILKVWDHVLRGKWCVFWRNDELEKITVSIGVKN